MRLKRHSRSLLTALFARMSLLVVLIVVIVGLLAFSVAQGRIDRAYDGQLIIGANVLRSLMSEELRESAEEERSEQMQVDDSPLLSAEDRQAFDDYAEWRMFRIWRGGKLVLGSDTGPKMAGPAPVGFSDIHSGKGRWRLYTLRATEPDVLVAVGERQRIRSVLVRAIALGLAVPLLLLIPLASALIWWSLSDGLRTVRQLVDAIGQRSLRDLAPVTLEPWPRDLHPLVRTINRVLARIEGSLHHERQFLDNAAHQLRTPLASVRLQAQLLAQEDDPRERALLGQELIAGVDRAAAMTDGLLTLARLEAQLGGGGRGDLRTETIGAVADLAPLAAKQDVELVFSGDGALPGGDPVLLRLVAANLIENALHHAPAGSEVVIALTPSANARRLTVTDAGPGIPPEDREQVLQRFYRRPGETRSGAGLGLSIVVQAVRLLNGQLRLSDRPDGRPGLSAQVDLPLSPEA
jgi:signal transduction histidine kinase